MAKINVPIQDRTLTRKTILLVEDNRDDEALTLRALRKSNIMNEVVVARDGEQARDYLFGSGNFSNSGECEFLPAVVLLDLKLPRIGGIDVLREIRSNPRTQRLPVVVLTSSQEERDLVDACDLGANSYLHKPIDFEKFLEAVGQIGMYWVLFNENPALTPLAR
ncbi:MAG: response regulator [Akkermansiaceae bacterium]|nr:response regulator [Verrucomicrobiales bacterium]